METIDAEECVAKIKMGFKDVCDFEWRLTVGISERKQTSAEITADVLNDYIVGQTFVSTNSLEATPFQSIGDGWIEISREGALYYLSEILKYEHIGWRGDEMRTSDLPLRLSHLFVDFFSDPARFFCHGLTFVIPEYPIYDANTRWTRVRRAFPFVQTKDYMYNSYWNLTEDLLDNLLGLVACSKTHVGHLYTPDHTG